MSGKRNSRQCMRAELVWSLFTVVTDFAYNLKPSCQACGESTRACIGWIGV
jgi:hypothetical protein